MGKKHILEKERKKILKDLRYPGVSEVLLFKDRVQVHPDGVGPGEQDV